MKNIFILGSTGSIGKSTLDVIAQQPNEFSAKVLAVNSNIELLRKQILTFEPEIAVIYNEDTYSRFIEENTIENTTILKGQEGLKYALHNTDLDIFLNAFVGFAGFEPTIEAIKKKLDIAIANKETFVVAGEFITNLAKENEVNLLPVDSEHSAIWQCLQGEENNKIKRIILTASGGPFLSLDNEELKNISVNQALNHPNWKMGNKITIDSATMMNKGLEVIEAYWLYNVEIEQIEVVIHPQSIIHSMVEFEDNSIKAQMGLPDMRIPIQYALGYPNRYLLEVEQLDFTKTKELTFELPDFEKFSCLKLAFDAIKLGKTYPAVLNAANEIAVDAFLNNKIGFVQIPQIIEDVLNRHQPMVPDSYKDYLHADKIGRESALSLIKGKQN